MHKAVLPSILGSSSLMVISSSLGFFLGSILYVPLIVLPFMRAVKSPLTNWSSIFLPSFSTTQVPSSEPCWSPPPWTRLAAPSSALHTQSQRNRVIMHLRSCGIGIGGHYTDVRGSAKC